jgi:uncharacterized protein
VSAGPAKARVVGVDALRGLALVGMLVVHVQYYADGPPVWADRVQTLIDALFTERFWALFAFLFGVGFALQIERWGDEPGFVRLYLRRLLVLAIFATLIAAFSGYRVLLGYSFWGLVLLMMRKWSQRALLIAAVVIALCGPAVSAVRWQVEKRTIGLEASNERAMRGRMIFRTYNQEQERIREHGTFPQLMAHRLRFELGAFLRWTWYVPGPDMLMFVLGLFAVRRGVLREPEKHRALLITVVVLGVALGQAGDHIPPAWLHIAGEPLRVQGARVGLMFAVLNPMFQGLAYAAALLLWIAHARAFPRLCAWLAQAGRMSLTNYVVQICALELLFEGAGLKITRPLGLLFAVIFFAAQILYSRWWFARYRIGPLEWLWRSLTYGERQRLRNAPPAFSQV